MTNFRFRLLLAGACACALAACGGDSAAVPGPIATMAPTPSPTPTPTPPPAPQSVERSIRPADTSSAITTNLQPHFVINPNPQVTARNRLFVMLPGTLAVANTYQDVVRTGAARGYHAIGLTYPNDDAIEGLCGNSPDPDCAEDARNEAITGQNTSTLVSINEANSITNRLIVLLQFLDRNFPNEGWGQYLTNGQPRWDLITVAGHSQGGGHAGFLAKRVLLGRAVMFSSPGDTGPNGTASAGWLSLPNVTPVERQFGFTHTQDPLLLFAGVSQNWSAIGLNALGPLTSVDGQTAPFGNSHQLTTSAPPNPNPTGPSAAPAHGAPVVDAVTPRDAQGRPIYEPVWIYLAFP